MEFILLVLENEWKIGPVPSKDMQTSRRPSEMVIRAILDDAIQEMPAS